VGVKDRVRKLEGGDPPPACEDQPCKRRYATEWEPWFDEDGQPVYAEACPYPRGEFEDEVVAVKQLRLLSGTVPPPRCEGCPMRRTRRVYHQRVVRNAYGIRVA
jgi:hypothetical protein